MAHVGRYEIVRQLKGGGMGSVTLARAPDGDLVVLKRPYDPDHDACERLRDEARIGARLLHPAIVDTLDLFEDEGAPVLVVSFVDGLSLEQLRGYGPMPTALVARIGRQIAEALDELHSATNEQGELLNILHRDVSPGNIMVDRAGDACLIDLGIARFDDRRADKTQAGFLRGTMRYLAPELIQGASYSWQSDLWSLGMVLWEAALGHFAYPADNDREIVVNIIEGKPMSHGGAHVAPELRDAIAPMLEPDPDKRAASAAEVVERLRIVEDVFEDAQAVTAEAIRMVLEKQAQLAESASHPIIGEGPSLEATESLSIPLAPASGPSPEVDDFAEETEVEHIIDVPRPVSFVGAHPYPELRDAPLEPPPIVDDDDDEPTRVTPMLTEAPEPASLASEEVDEVPRDVSILAGPPAHEIRSEDHPPIGGPAVVLPPPVDGDEETIARGPPISGWSPQERWAPGDEYLNVDVDLPDVDVLDQVRAQVESTRVVDGFPSEEEEELSIDLNVDVELGDLDPSARPPEEESLDVEPLEPLEPDEMTELGPPPVSAEAPAPAADDAHEEEPTRDISLPGAEPAPAHARGPRLTGRRRPSSQYLSVSPRAEREGAEPVKPGELGGEVAIGRIGLKRVAVRRDSARSPAISVQAVPRVPDSDRAADTAVQSFLGTPGFEQPEELSAEAFVRPRGRTNPGLSALVVEPAPSAAHAEISHLSAVTPAPYEDDEDDEDDEDQDRMSLDDVLDILDD